MFFAKKEGQADALSIRIVSRQGAVRCLAWKITVSVVSIQLYRKRSFPPSPGHALDRRWPMSWSYWYISVSSTYKWKRHTRLFLIRSWHSIQGVQQRSQYRRPESRTRLVEQFSPMAINCLRPERYDSNHLHESVTLDTKTISKSLQQSFMNIEATLKNWSWNRVQLTWFHCSCFNNGR